MNFIKKLKKGFTIVELVIVIAVLAILAAVLVPTFANVVEKANQSADTQLVRNLNTILIEEESSGSKPTSVGEVLALEEENGYNVANLQAKAKDYHLVWNPVTNRFYKAKVEGNSVSYETYPGLSNPTEQTYEMWTIASKPSDIFSTYLYKATEKTFTVSTGLDVGEETGIELIKYENPGDAQSVMIRTNGSLCELQITAPNDHVDHYGYSYKTTVVSVDPSNSYHEYGTSYILEATAGKIVIEDIGIVFELNKTSAESSATFTNTGNVMAINTNNVGDPVLTEGSSTVTGSFEINNLAQLEAFRDATNSGVTFAEKTINLNCDITLTSPWVPISNYYRSGNDENNHAWSTYYFSGKFNGNNHTINGLTNKGLISSDYNHGRNKSSVSSDHEAVYGFFASTAGATICNLTFKNVDISAEAFGNFIGDSVAACVGFTSGKTIVSNITVEGSISGFDAVAGIIGRDKGNYLSVENCTNKATIFAYSSASGIVCRIYGDYTETVAEQTSHLQNCINEGNVTADFANSPATVKDDNCYASGIAGIRNNSNENCKTFKFDSCTNNGVITYRKNRTTNYQQNGHSALILATTTPTTSSKYEITNCTAHGELKEIG